MSKEKRQQLINDGLLNPDGSRPSELNPEGNGHGVAKPDTLTVGATAADLSKNEQKRRSRGRKK